MHLLRARTCTLEEFPSDPPTYLILSHTWGSPDEEVTFQELKARQALDKPGFQKILQACAETLRRGHHYLWVDTCCINKESSAELSEAINSMFRYYAEAKNCLAYLADVHYDTVRQNSPDAISACLRPSHWFTRGWTLQELLAPRTVIFFDTAWREIGTRESLATCISDITRIRECYLRDTPSVDSRSRLLQCASVAERLAWAARRTTTKLEDMTYCLLGIFGVNMPLIYGEGEGAFFRFQEHLIRQYPDPTLLAWQGDPDLSPLEWEPADPPRWRRILDMLFLKQDPWRLDTMKRVKILRDSSILAASPRDFLGCEDVVAHKDISLDWSLTSRGLRISLPKSDNMTPQYVVLPCYFRHHPGHLLAVPLQADIWVEDLLYSRLGLPLRPVWHSKWHLWNQREVLFKLSEGPSWGKRDGIGGDPRGILYNILLCFDPTTIRLLGKFEAGEWSPHDGTVPMDPEEGPYSVLVRCYHDCVKRDISITSFVFEKSREGHRFSMLVAVVPKIPPPPWTVREPTQSRYRLQYSLCAGVATPDAVAALLQNLSPHVLPTYVDLGGTCVQVVQTENRVFRRTFHTVVLKQSLATPYRLAWLKMKDRVSQKARSGKQQVRRVTDTENGRSYMHMVFAISGCVICLILERRLLGRFDRWTTPLYVFIALFRISNTFLRYLFPRASPFLKRYCWALSCSLGTAATVAVFSDEILAVL